MPQGRQIRRSESIDALVIGFSKNQPTFLDYVINHGNLLVRLWLFSSIWTKLLEET